VRAADDDLKNKDIVSSVLYARGITDAAEIECLLNPSLKKQMPDPYVLKDMAQGVVLIADAIAAGKKIAIFGDYDVDGITSTAIMLKYLRDAGVPTLWHLPTREGEGYGLNRDAIRDLRDQGADVLISVDCGISAVAEVEYAKSLGMTVVITDHHSPDIRIPGAHAVVDPKREDDASGLTYLAGVGVAFMFLVGLNRLLRDRGARDVNLLDYLDLVALGTICDTMPLIGLNRAFVATGLKVLDSKKNLGLKTLMAVSSVKRASVYTAGFAIGPRLNAAGRLDSANPALELMMTDNPLIARNLAEKLNLLNAERVGIQNAIMISAVEMARKCKKDGRRSLFICGDNWHGGVMGIIAGRLKDQFYMPTCVATRAHGVVNGSGRSVPDVDLGAIIQEALRMGILSEGGGHAAAAGFSLSVDKEAEFYEFMERAVSEQRAGRTPQPEIRVDAEIDAGGASLALVHEMSALAPFGQGNPEPTLVLHGGTLSWVSPMSGTHLRGALRTSAGTNLQLVGFNLVNTPVGEFMLDDGNKDRKIVLCGKLKENDYNGRVTAQFVIEDAVLP
jgi:single-stranded-DNA-specific exonuclease